MANLNKVMLMGNITRDITVTYLPANQTPVCDFGLAVNRTWTGQDGVKKEEVTFVDCTAFGKQAETLGKYKKKGDPLFIEGRLKLDQWQGEDGGKRSKLKVIVENFQFLNRAQPGGYGGGGGGAPAADPGEYAGEPAAAPAPRPYNRPVAGRPGVQPRPAAAPPPAAPNYDAGDVPSVPADEAPPISQDDIPF